MQPEKKVRTIKELLQLMLDNQQLFNSGLCSWVIELYIKDKISYDEKSVLNKFIQNNPPFLYSIVNRFSLYNHGYYWDYADIKPRLKWLNKHINKH